jgi:MFS family permease
MANHLKELYSYRSVPELAASRSLFAFAQAMIAAVWAILFSESGLSDSKISFLKVVIAVTVLSVSLILPRYLEKLDESKIYPLSLMISGLSLIAVAFYKNLAVVILAFGLAQMLYVVRQSTFSILFRDSFRRFNVYTLAQGIIGSMVCTAWFIGPILSGLIMEDFGPRRVMLFAGLIFVLSSLIASYKAVGHKTKKLKSSPSPIANVKVFLKIDGIRSGILNKIWYRCLVDALFYFYPANYG